MNNKVLLPASVCLLVLACGKVEQKKPNVPAVPVAVALVERGNFVVTAVFTGEIVAEVANIAAETQGRLESVPARIGDIVKTGDVLATIDSRQLRLQLAAAQARAAAAAAEQGPAIAELDRSLPLIEQGLISQQTLDELRAKVAAIVAATQAAEAEVALLAQRVADATIRSPIDGIVSAREQNVGTWVSPGTPLFRIVSNQNIYARLRIPEAQINLVQPRAPVKLEIAGFSEALSGVVRGISAEIRPNDRSAWAEVTIAPSRGLSHGMFVRATIELTHLNNVAIVPAAAIIERLSNNQIIQGIFIAKDGYAVWVTAHALANDANRAAISADLPAATPVLIRGHLALSHGAPIQVASNLITAATSR